MNLLTQRPEILNPLDEVQADKLARVPGLALGEVAGRDSIAAILEALKDDRIASVLPTAAYTGTEYGDWQQIARNVDGLREVARERFEKEVWDLAWLGSPALWRALNGRFLSELVNRFEFYSPCLGCHLYLHAIRIPLAVRLGSSIIIGGERETHDSGIKINQTSLAIEAYTRVLQDFGIELVLPLRKIGSGEAIEGILGSRWKEGAQQMECVLSGNYRGVDGSVDYHEGKVRRYFTEFAMPAVEEVIRRLLQGEEVPYEKVIGEYLR